MSSSIDQANQVIKCKDCGVEFVFTKSEQEYFSERNFTNPTRCKPCRKKVRENKEKYAGVYDAFKNKQNIYRGSVNTRYGRAGKLSQNNF